MHGGKQAMPLNYDNSTAAYSEAECTFSPAQDWTVHGAKTLSLWFYGPAANKGGQLYLKVNGTKVAYAGAAADLTKAQWVQWTVESGALGRESGEGHVADRRGRGRRCLGRALRR